MRGKKLGITILILVVMVTASFILTGTKIVQASSISITLSPTDDAQISQHLPYSTNGFGNRIDIRNYFGGDGSSNWGYEGLVKFNLSSIPENSTISSAILRLWYAGYTDTNPQGRRLNLYAITSDWNESIVTWNTHPSYTSQLTNYATVPWSTGVWMEWNVTVDIQSYIDGNISLYGWKIADEKYWGLNNIPATYFSSKEGSHASYVDIEYKASNPGMVYVDDNFNFSTPGWQYDHFNVIQDGIDAVAENGTVYVYNGTYYENVVVNKTINLIGEDKNGTIIDGQNKESCIEIWGGGAGGITISSFTLENTKITGGWYGAAINISGSNHTINKVICKDSNNGIFLVLAENCHISNCWCYNNFRGLMITNWSSNNIFENCELENNSNSGIFIFDSFDNLIKDNFVENNTYGAYIYGNQKLNNLIYNNYFKNNIISVYEDEDNVWNISKTLGTNIIGGSYLGGNYWSDYAGVDLDEDGLGDTNLPYNSSGGIINGGDWHPLTASMEIDVGIMDSNIHDGDHRELGNGRLKVVIKNNGDCNVSTYVNFTLEKRNPSLPSGWEEVDSGTKGPYDLDPDAWIESFFDMFYDFEGEYRATFSLDTYCQGYKIHPDSNPDNDVYQATFTVDSTPPWTDIWVNGTLGKNDWYVGDYVVIAFLAHDNGSGVDRTMYRLDGGDWQIYKDAMGIWKNGNHAIEYYSVDNAGNVEETKSYDFKLDNKPPEVEVIYPNGGGTLNGTVTIEWDASDNIDSSLQMKIEYSGDNGTTWHKIAADESNDGTYEWDTAGLAGGTDYLIRISTSDDAGNYGADTSDDTFAIQPAIPLSVSLVKPRGYLYINDREIMPLPGNTTIVWGAITIEATAESGMGIEKVEFYVDDGLKATVADAPYRWLWDESAFFTRTIKVIAYDNAGNTATDEQTVWIFNL